jgi:hypothetical protein
MPRSFDWDKPRAEFDGLSARQHLHGADVPSALYLSTLKQQHGRCLACHCYASRLRKRLAWDGAYLICEECKKIVSLSRRSRRRLLAVAQYVGRYPLTTLKLNIHRGF